MLNVSCCRWFVIKDTYVAYIRPSTNELRFPILVDHGFTFSSGFHRTGVKNGIEIRNLQRKFLIICRNKYECNEWKQSLSKLIERANDFRSPTVNRFNSFAPIRRNQYAHW